MGAKLKKVEAPDTAIVVIVEEYWQMGIAAKLFPGAVVVRAGGVLTGLRIGVLINTAQDSSLYPKGWVAEVLSRCVPSCVRLYACLDGIPLRFPWTAAEAVEAPR